MLLGARCVNFRIAFCIRTPQGSIAVLNYKSMFYTGRFILGQQPCAELAVQENKKKLIHLFVQLIHLFVNVVLTENLQNIFCYTVIDFKKQEMSYRIHYMGSSIQQHVKSDYSCQRLCCWHLRVIWLLESRIIG